MKNKSKNTKNIQIHLDYLLELAFLGIQSKAKEMFELANKKQIRLGKVKRLFCKKCYTVLIPKKTAESAVMNQNGIISLESKCLVCNNIAHLSKNKK